MYKKLGLILTYLVYVIAIIGTLIVALQPYLAVAEAIPEPTRFNYSEGDKIPEFVIDQLIARYTDDTLLAHQVKQTLYCESRFYNVQSNVIKNGLRENSWGISQIHLDSHKQITKSQALDVEFAIKWTIDNFQTTKWYGYNRVTDTCNN